MFNFYHGNNNKNRTNGARYGPLTPSTILVTGPRGPLVAPLVSRTILLNGKLKPQMFWSKQTGYTRGMRPSVPRHKKWNARTWVYSTKLILANSTFGTIMSRGFVFCVAFLVRLPTSSVTTDQVKRKFYFVSASSRLCTA